MIIYVFLVSNTWRQIETGSASPSARRDAAGAFANGLFCILYYVFYLISFGSKV